MTSNECINQSQKTVVTFLLSYHTFLKTELDPRVNRDHQSVIIFALSGQIMDHGGKKTWIHYSVKLGGPGPLAVLFC